MCDSVLSRINIALTFTTNISILRIQKLIGIKTIMKMGDVINTRLPFLILHSSFLICLFIYPLNIPQQLIAPLILFRRSNENRRQFFPRFEEFFFVSIDICM